VPTAPSKVSRSRRVRSTHNVVPGYTILIFDTNVLLSSLSLFSKVVEGGQWSVVVPLPVVTELDGLSKNPPPLGTEAAAAVAYLEARIRTHALCLKIQTSRGNYLTDLLIRAETLDLRSREHPRTMDDMILNVASFQRDHFVDRSALLGQARPVDGAPTQVLLVTFDRNLRLKARARGIDAADEREMAAILAK
jgi:predicted ribonuclease YlaK